MSSPAGLVDTSTPDTVTTGSLTRRLAARGILVLLALSAAGYVGQHWWHGLTHVRTDNAQVHGHIVPVLAKIGGHVAAVAVEDNQRVAAGDLLVRLDARHYQARVRQAQGRLLALQAKVGNEEQVGQAVAEVKAARARAAAARARLAAAAADAEHVQRELARIREMSEGKWASQQQLEAAEAAVRTAEAELRATHAASDAAAAEVAVATATLRGAQGELLAAEAEREQAAVLLEDTRIHAPAAGVVSKRNVEVGQLVQPGQALMSVVPVEALWIVANLKETEIRDVDPGDPVEVRLDAYPDAIFRGEVESLGAATGSMFSLLPPDNATGNFTKVVQRIPVRIRLAPDQHPGYPLRPGMSAVVDIQTR